jgi:DNA invertase Pin-like site-specific DNA recombinase
MSTRVALYARVSTEHQQARGTIGSQLAVLRERITAEGGEVVAEFRDDGCSGDRCPVLRGGIAPSGSGWCVG